MKKFYVMGNYSAKAFQGFVKDPTQDRKKAVETILQATGGKIHSFDIVRGNVDFVAVVDAENFEIVCAAICATFRPGAFTTLRMIKNTADDLDLLGINLVFEFRAIL